MTDLATRELAETMARAMYEGAHRGLKNVWGWDDSGLDDEHPNARQQHIAQAQATLSALDAAGYAVVPKEPTEAMLNANDVEAYVVGCCNASPGDLIGIYRAMIAASSQH